MIALHWASTAGFRADAFADSEADDFAATRWRRTAESNARPKSSNNIHIRIRQRKDKKSITTVQGPSEHFDLKQIIKALKKVHPISRVSVQIIRSRRSETHRESGFLQEAGFRKVGLAPCFRLPAFFRAEPQHPRLRIWKQEKSSFTALMLSQGQVLSLSDRAELTILRRVLSN